MRFLGKLFRLPNHPVGLALVAAEADEDGELLLLGVTEGAAIKQWSLRIEKQDLVESVLPASLALGVRVDNSFCLQAQNLGEQLAVLTSECLERILRQQVKFCAYNHYQVKHKNSAIPFKAGDRIGYAGRVFDEREVLNLIDSSLDFWLTSGRYCEEFELAFSKKFKVRHCRLVNSGSSANLIAFNTLTSTSLGDRRIKKGDEVITVAAGFPTTVAPIIQYGAVPVFVDVSLPSYNIDTTKLEEALSERTRAVMLAHTLGNPFDLQRVKDFCDKHRLWLVEDNCDALGAQFFYNGEWRNTGTIGDLATSSFYPPHHMTMGEGGAVYTSSPKLNRIAGSFRDWGRDCWCDSGKDNTCGKRFSTQLGELPMGYDHKYTYSHFGFNLKVTDMQAAIGCAQLEKIDGFVAARNKNWQYLRDAMAELSDCFVLPEASANSRPSWFGFLLTVRGDAGVSRKTVVNHLESNGVQTRMLFAGNFLSHPCFDEMRKSKEGYRVIGNLSETDRIMTNSFWVGVYPGMTTQMLDFMIEKIKEACNNKQ